MELCENADSTGRTKVFPCFLILTWSPADRSLSELLVPSNIFLRLEHVPNRVMKDCKCRQQKMKERERQGRKIPNLYGGPIFLCLKYF